MQTLRFGVDIFLLNLSWASFDFNFAWTISELENIRTENCYFFKGDNFSSKPRKW